MPKPGVGLAAAVSALCLIAAGPVAIKPDYTETRTVKLTQTVTLHDIPSGARQVRMWVPVPSDRAWQRVLDRRVVAAPGAWQMIQQADGLGDFLYVVVDDPGQQTASVVIECVIDRTGVHYPLAKIDAPAAIQAAMFEEALDTKAPLMESDERVCALADQICGDEKDPARQALLLLQAVADGADHYSKDATKPVCGRGAAADCLDQGGGCCTDLHSLFISMARSRGIPARMQYGYRMLDAKAGQTYDPGYRCWVEFFIPGAGWIPTDIVASDNAGSENPAQWASLSSTRVWLWEGRSFELTPPAQAGPVHTMTCGWAEIDGRPIDPVPSRDGSIPAQLRRTVQFEVIGNDRPANGPKLPE